MTAHDSLPSQNRMELQSVGSDVRLPSPRSVDRSTPHLRGVEEIAARKTIRVLHLVAGLNRAGTETWLVSLLPHLFAQRIHCDFMVNEDKTYDYSKIVEDHGSRILVCDEYQNRLAFACKFSRLLKTNGLYDVVHCHTSWFSGIEAFVAAVSGVKNRIVHAHSDTSLADAKAKWKRRFAIGMMDFLIRNFATGGLATSEKAGRSLLRRRWRSSPNWKIHLSTSDLRKFEPREREPSLRANLDIPEESFVIGHVGRFVPPKNHEFLLHAFLELLKLNPGSHLICVGDGPDKPAVADVARRLNILGQVRLLPATDEVYKYVTGVFDVFVLPSLTEGLGIVAVEAQAAGIPAILSDRIPPEAYLIPELIKVLSLDDSPEKWAQAMAAAHPVASIKRRKEWFREVTMSEFEPELNAKNLASYYRSVSE